MAKKQQRAGLTYLDPRKLNRANRKRLSLTQIAKQTGLGWHTVDKAFKGHGILYSSAEILAHFFGMEVDSLRAAEDEEINADDEPNSGEWEIVDYVGSWSVATNQLRFRVCWMQHRYIEERIGRGKWYDLLHLSHREREDLREQLVRHAFVCERVGYHPNVVSNYTSAPGKHDDCYWIVDRWINGVTLEEQLADGPMDRTKLPRLMLDIALGLQKLHEADVVFRELAPSRVILAEDGRAVLTDFELAKLINRPTVSTKWPTDPYRAPEVQGRYADVRSDLYSWGCVLVHAITGLRPNECAPFDAITQAGLPKAMWRIAMDCLSPGPSERPKDMKPVIKAVKKWAESIAGAKGE